MADASEPLPPQSMYRFHSDVMLPMHDPYMQQIIDGLRTYEFRTYLLSGVKRLWFYRTRPYSALTHFCEVEPARTRAPGDIPLPEDGLGNAEFNSRHPDFKGYDYAYRIVSLYELLHPLALHELKDKHGVRMAARGRMYLPRSVWDSLAWNRQKKLR